MKVCPVCKAEYAGGEVFCPVDASRLSSPSQMGSEQVQKGDPLVGTILNDRYRIHGRIGEGGMGIVYEAEHVVIEKRVALKVLRDDFSSRPEVVERFRQEAKSASRIGHEHIVDISDFGETPQGQSYFVMEYLRGEDVASVLAREATLAPSRVMNIAVQCCRALGAAHGKGIVHRDMKPENIFLVNRDDGSDFVKIVDFGIAKMSDIETSGSPGRKLTKTGTIFGTPEYMSPEQAGGKELDHRVDIYALGVILFETLTGRTPFVGDSFMGILTQHMFEQPPSLTEVNPNLRAPEGLEAVVMKAIAKSPDDRFQTMDEFAAALRNAQERKPNATQIGHGAPVQASPPKPQEIGPQPTAEFSAPKRPSWRMGIMAVAAGGLIAVAGLAVWIAAQPGTSTADANGQQQSAAESDAPGKTEGDPGGSSSGDPSTAVAMADENGNGSTSAGEQGGNKGKGSTSAGEQEQDKGASQAQGEDASAAEPERQAETGGTEPAGRVKVTVETRPEGAEVQVAGRGTVCDETPCSFQTPPDEPIRLRARRGRWVGAQRLDPRESKTVRIQLSKRRRRGRQGSSDRSPGDLKPMPDWMRSKGN